MKIRVQKNKEKAKSLTAMAKITLERLKETDREKFPSNSLTDYYDIIRKLMEALTYLEGIKIKGEGSHQKIIDYICKKHNLGEATRQFIQEVREYRNRISYEGFMIKINYIKDNRDKIERIIRNLLDIIEKNKAD